MQRRGRGYRPLLNGVDPVALLRTRCKHVLAGAIVVESERVEPGLVLHKRGSRLVLAPGPRREQIVRGGRRHGIATSARDELVRLVMTSTMRSYESQASSLRVAVLTR
jgi:hypothetical protein